MEERGLISSQEDTDRDFDGGRMYRPREMFQGSPVAYSESAEGVHGGATNTSSEFEKLMQPFHSILQLNYSQDQENDDFEDNDDGKFLNYFVVFKALSIAYFLIFF